MSLATAVPTEQEPRPKRARRSQATIALSVYDASARKGNSLVSSIGPTAGSQSRRQVVAASALDSRRMSQLSNTPSWAIRTRR